MDYKKIYDALIQKRRDFPLVKGGEIYCETHHITPKCMNGSDKESNLVNLTAREHYIAHLLLWKHYKEINYHLASPLLTAITYMQCKSKCIAGRVFDFNSRLYEKIKLQVKERNSMMRSINDGVHTKRIFKDEPLPEGWSEGVISNFSNTFMITNGTTNKRITKGEPIPDGWWSGNSGADCLTGMICITNGKVNKYINPGDEIDPGFHIGTHSKSCTGLHAITNGTEVRYISDDEKLPDGWKFGGHKGKKQFITNGIDNMVIDKNASIPDGWRAGTTMEIKIPRKNTRIIRNLKLKKNKRLRVGEILTQEMIDDGWEYGRYISDAAREEISRRSIHLTVNGETHTIREWSEITGIKPVTIKKRYHDLYLKGITDYDVIFSTKGCILSK